MKGNNLLWMKNLFISIREGDLIRLSPVLRDWEAMVRMHFLYSAIESGLINALRNPCSKDELIIIMRVNRFEILEALLELGISCGEISLKDGFYALSGKRVRALIGKNGDAIAALIQGNVTYYNSIYQKSIDILRGAQKVDFLEDIGEIVARYSKIIEPYISRVIIDSVINIGEMRYLDIGCGTGIYLKKAVETNPHLDGIGIEMDSRVILNARENIQRWGIAEKVRIIEGDIRNPPSELSDSYDLITFFNAIYYLTVEERIGVFTRLHKLLSDSGKLIIVSSFRGGAMDMATANLNFATSCLNGCTPLPTVMQIKEQLLSCGFDQISTASLLPGGSVFRISAT